MHDVDPLDYLRFHILAGGCVTLCLDGAAVAVGGVSGPSADNGCIWFLGADAIERKPLAFCRATKALLPQVVRGWRRVGNYVPTMRTSTICWLRYLGFDFGEVFVHQSGIEVVRFCMTFDTALHEPTGP